MPLSAPCAVPGKGGGLDTADPGRRLTSPEKGASPRQVPFHSTPISLPRRHRLMRCRPGWPLRGFAFSLEGGAAAPILMAAKGPDRLPVPMTGRLAFSPFGFFRSSHNARMPQTLADPAGGRSQRPRSFSRNERFDLFSPPLTRLLAQVKKGSPLSHPPLAFRACGCGPDRPRQLIAIEAAMVVASNEKPKENDNG